MQSHCSSIGKCPQSLSNELTLFLEQTSKSGGEKGDHIKPDNPFGALFLQFRRTSILIPQLLLESYFCRENIL